MNIVQAKPKLANGNPYYGNYLNIYMFIGYTKQSSSKQQKL